MMCLFLFKIECRNYVKRTNFNGKNIHGEICIKLFNRYTVVTGQGMEVGQKNNEA